jgi:hypothetical protein
MIKKTKFSTITAVVATIAALTAMGSIGGGIGLGQQQMALAQPVDPRDIGGDIGDIGDTVRDIFEDDDDNGGNDGERRQLCPEPGQIFIPRSLGGPRCADARDFIQDALGPLPNVVSDDADDRDPEVPQCTGPGEIFIPRGPLGGPRCINTNIDASPGPA